MANLASPVVGTRDERFVRDSRVVEAGLSAVSWPAIIAGAFGAAAISLILVALGAGFGLASISPWSNEGVSATTFTVMTGIWFVIVQWLASALGGYITGRLRTKWVGAHTHEVFFRDTAHGFLTWAVATVVTAGVLSAAASSLAAGGARIAADAAIATSADPDEGNYAVDKLFRSTRADVAAQLSDARSEASRILAQGLVAGDVPASDRDYLISSVASRAGIPAAEAQARVDGEIANVKAAHVKARDAADAARKASLMFSILTAVSMLIGAFIASTAAAIGGSLRDEQP
jgi:hypothetical protein